MSFVVVGLNHRTAPIEVRERYAFAANEVPVTLADLLESQGVLEAVLISTW